MLRAFVILSLVIIPFAPPQVQKVETKAATKRDVSKPLKNVPAKRSTKTSGQIVKPLRSIPTTAASLQQQVQVTASLKNDVSPRLATVAPKRVEAGPVKRVIPLRRIVPSSEGLRPAAPTINDRVAQTRAPQAIVEANPEQNFPGLGTGLGTFRPAASPPDTNGVIGPDQYVQWVNNSFAIFSKTGT